MNPANCYKNWLGEGSTGHVVGAESGDHGVKTEWGAGGLGGVGVRGLGLLLLLVIMSHALTPSPPRCPGTCPRRRRGRTRCTRCGIGVKTGLGFKAGRYKAPAILAKLASDEEGEGVIFLSMR